MKHNRLFLFAAYDPNNTVNDALFYYVSQLSKFGDVIFCMDNDCQKTELNKLKNYTITAIAKRHGEYDFGSYKRAYQYAYDNDILKNYDNIYIVNDSVFGPLFDLTKTLDNLESTNTDATGLIVSKHKTHAFMESWFVRLGNKIFNTDWFRDFMESVDKQPTKAQITIKYEHGLSNLIHKHGLSWGGLYICHGRFTYNNPKKLFKRGCPFIKKACFNRHNGAIGNQIKYILNHCQINIQLPIITTANKLYGPDYMNWLLTYNPIKIVTRKVKYLGTKLKNGGI